MVSPMIGVAVALWSGPARAHLNSTGMGPIYDGSTHFLLSPEDLVPVLALALLSGQRGAPFGRRTLFVLPAAWLLGGLVGLSTGAANASLIGSALWLLLLGGLLAADVRLSLLATTALALALGLYGGFLNAAGMGPAGSATLSLLGLSLSIFVVVALTAALVVPLRAHWARIAVRVAGSWIAASGILLFGWAVRST
jgi:hydrogenase/urease accessory protein HupE